LTLLQTFSEDRHMCIVRDTQAYLLERETETETGDLQDERNSESRFAVDASGFIGSGMHA